MGARLYCRDRHNFLSFLKRCRQADAADRFSPIHNHNTEMFFNLFNILKEHDGCCQIGRACYRF